MMQTGIASIKGVVVSIHDVAPPFQETIAEILNTVKILGITRTSLLIVPDYHRQGNLNQDFRFCHWLRGLVKEGHEAVLHGFYHLRASSSREPLWMRGI